MLGRHIFLKAAAGTGFALPKATGRDQALPAAIAMAYPETLTLRGQSRAYTHNRPPTELLSCQVNASANKRYHLVDAVAVEDKAAGLVAFCLAEHRSGHPSLERGYRNCPSVDAEIAAVFHPRIVFMDRENLALTPGKMNEIPNLDRTRFNVDDLALKDRDHDGATLNGPTCCAHPGSPMEDRAPHVDDIAFLEGVQINGHPDTRAPTIPQTIRPARYPLAMPRRTEGTMKLMTAPVMAMDSIIQPARSAVMTISRCEVAKGGGNAEQEAGDDGQDHRCAKKGQESVGGHAAGSCQSE